MAVAVQAVQQALDVPRVALEPVVKRAKHLLVEGEARFREECRGETVVGFPFYRIKGDGLCALVERAFGREEHFLHHVLLAPGEYETRIGQKLDMGAQKGFDPLFGVFRYLLELVDGQDAAAAGRAQVVEDFFERGFFPVWSDVEAHLGHAGQLVEGERGAAAFQELADAVHRFLGEGIQLAEHRVAQ